jgi:transposase InsO family protein
MSREISPATGKAYGVKRVCAVLNVSRSTVYARQKAASLPRPTPARRGPKPKVSDDALLEAIRADLDASPFVGEGHRKVWARLKFGKGIRVSRKRVLRLMREHNLLSPYRKPQGTSKDHDGTIGTQAPNVMWGTDGARVFTVEEGYGWIFVAVEHWNAECMGVHVCKKGDRMAALEPVAQGVLNQFGSIERGAARGLALRMDHGPQYISDHFHNQITAWGMAPSFAFLREPETNGVAERFIRTLKEQAIYGRIFQNLEEVREAVAEFVDLYNRQWLVEKNGLRSPYEMRDLQRLPEAACAC